VYLRGIVNTGFCRCEGNQSLFAKLSVELAKINNGTTERRNPELYIPFEGNCCKSSTLFASLQDPLMREGSSHV
jgi:hypothetical protein